MADVVSLSATGGGKMKRTCVICLETCTDETLTDPCFHPFCMRCIRRWTKVQTEATCPLCMRTVSALYYDIKSEKDFKKLELAESSRKAPTEDRAGSSQRRGRRLEPPPRRSDRNLPAGLTEKHVFRRYIYMRGLHAQPLWSSVHRLNMQGGKIRVVVDDRVKEWIVRELQALLWAAEVSLVSSVAFDTLSLGIVGSELVEHMRPYLFDKAEHFDYELTWFSASAYPMHVYDRIVSYPSSARTTALEGTPAPAVVHHLSRRRRERVRRAVAR
mmetsp:Transcript_1169/g.3622  ORF Transcript_1169/g.3622 Transcript_1169/m.3622 type:complete len:272 (-) Transcript_1169:122-937(-)